MNAPTARIRVTPQLTAQEIRAVLDLAAESARADGAYPLNEHVVLHLRHPDADSLHLVAEVPGSSNLLGYAHLDLTDTVQGPSAELAVRPTARRRGVGGMLLDEAVRQAEGHPGGLRLWAHGAEGAANELAEARGFHRTRQLWQLRRSLYAPLDPVALPPGISLRPFDPERDRSDWLELNARAFTDLPDQAGWTLADLEQRMAESWFDPSGFLMAQDADGRLVGFHWTKVHEHDDHTQGGHERHVHDAGDAGTAELHAHDPIGEVYVVGVDPDMRGLGLGRSLTLAGLEHLRDRGLSTALLYVDADNTAAISLYRSLGFAPWDSDTLFRR